MMNFYQKIFSIGVCEKKLIFCRAPPPPKKLFGFSSIENTSYSAMLHIAESVPPPESVPSNSGIPFSFNHLDLFDNDRLPSNSGIERNRTELHGIPESNGIPRNSVQFRPIPEFHLGLTLMLPCVVKHTSGTS
jgi:hypothetical protein